MQKISFKVSEREQDAFDRIDCKGLELLRRGMYLAIDMERHLAEGRRLTLYDASKPSGDRALDAYAPEQDLTDPPLEADAPQPDAAALDHSKRTIVKAWPFNGETLQAWEHLRTYPRYRDLSKSQLLRYLIRLYSFFYKQASDGHTLVALDAQDFPREIRIRGFGSSLEQWGSRGNWLSQLAREENRALLQDYATGGKHLLALRVTRVAPPSLTTPYSCLRAS